MEGAQVTKADGIMGIMSLFLTFYMALCHACGIHLVLLFYGHWALDQWPQWPSALKPCPSWAQTPSMTATFPACISSRPSMSQTGFSAPKVVDSRWSDMSVALKRGIEFINKVPFPGYSRCWNGKKKDVLSRLLNTIFLCPLPPTSQNQNVTWEKCMKNITSRCYFPIYVISLFFNLKYPLNQRVFSVFHGVFLFLQ